MRSGADGSRSRFDNALTSGRPPPASERSTSVSSSSVMAITWSPLPNAVSMGGLIRQAPSLPRMIPMTVESS